MAGGRNKAFRPQLRLFIKCEVLRTDDCAMPCWLLAEINENFKNHDFNEIITFIILPEVHILAGNLHLKEYNRAKGRLSQVLRLYYVKDVPLSVTVHRGSRKTRRVDQA
jgi:hypothetical protein